MFHKVDSGMLEASAHVVSKVLQNNDVLCLTNVHLLLHRHETAASSQ